MPLDNKTIEKQRPFAELAKKPSIQKILGSDAESHIERLSEIIEDKFRQHSENSNTPKYRQRG